MIDKTQITRFLEFIQDSRRVFCFFPYLKNLELLLTSVAVELFFQDLSSVKKSDFQLKEIKSFCPREFTQLLKKWPTIKNYFKEKKLLKLVKTSMGKDNLLISFPYQPDQVDRVSYHISDDNQYFYLTIKPKQGNPALDHQQVKFSYTGASADLLMLIGVNDLADLGQLFENNQALFQNTPSITINDFIPDFGNLNLDISGSSGYGEAVFYLLKAIVNLLDLDLNSFNHVEEISTLLLTSIAIKSKNFTSMQMTANSYAAVGELLQLGAKRLVTRKVQK
jgi:hypothetical protein